GKPCRARLPLAAQGVLPLISLRHFQLFRSLAGWVLAAIVLTPVYWLLVTIVSPPRQVLSRSPRRFPSRDARDFSAFVRIFTERPVLNWLMNSVMMTSVAIVVTLLVSLPAGYAISRARGKIRD